MALSLDDGPASRIGAELFSPAINEHPSGPIEVHERNIKNLSLRKSPNYRKAEELVRTLSRNEYCVLRRIVQCRRSSVMTIWT